MRVLYHSNNNSSNSSVTNVTKTIHLCSANEHNKIKVSSSKVLNSKFNDNKKVLNIIQKQSNNHIKRKLNTHNNKKQNNEHTKNSNYQHTKRKDRNKEPTKRKYSINQPTKRKDSNNNNQQTEVEDGMDEYDSEQSLLDAIANKLEEDLNRLEKKWQQNKIKRENFKVNQNHQNFKVIQSPQNLKVIQNNLNPDSISPNKLNTINTDFINPHMNYEETPEGKENNPKGLKNINLNKSIGQKIAHSTDSASGNAFLFPGAQLSLTQACEDTGSLKKKCSQRKKNKINFVNCCQQPCCLQNCCQQPCCPQNCCQQPCCHQNNCLQPCCLQNSCQQPCCPQNGSQKPFFPNNGCQNLCFSKKGCQKPCCPPLCCPPPCCPSPCCPPLSCPPPCCPPPCCQKPSCPPPFCPNPLDDIKALEDLQMKKQQQLVTSLTKQISSIKNQQHLLNSHQCYMLNFYRDSAAFKQKQIIDNSRPELCCEGPLEPPSDCPPSFQPSCPPFCQPSCPPCCPPVAQPCHPPSFPPSCPPCCAPFCPPSCQPCCLSSYLPCCPTSCLSSCLPCFPTCCPTTCSCENSDSDRSDEDSGEDELNRWKAKSDSVNAQLKKMKCTVNQMLMKKSTSAKMCCGCCSKNKCS